MPLRRAIMVLLCLGALAAPGKDRQLRRGLDLSFSGRPHIEKPMEVVHARVAPPAPSPRIRLCAYNIEHFTDGYDDWIQKTPKQAKRQAKYAAQLIERINPDVILIEEIENPTVVKRLNASMKKPFAEAFITRFGSDRDRVVSQNIAVLSRLPLKGLREIDFEGLSGAGRPPRGVLSFFIDLGPGRRLLVYGVHLKANVGKRSENYSKRWNALRIIRQDVEALRDKYPQYTWEALVAGDMNVDPQSRDFGDDPTFQPLVDWVDLWLGRPIEERTTIPTRYGDPSKRHPPQGFDRFILSPELMREPWIASIPKVIKAGVDTNDAHAVPGFSAAHVSDHYPVVLNLYRARKGPDTGGLIP